MATPAAARVGLSLTAQDCSWGDGLDAHGGEIMRPPQ